LIFFEKPRGTTPLGNRC